MFRLIEASSGQIQNTVLVHSVGAHYGIPYCLQNYTDINRIQHKLIGFYNPDEKCLQRGTDWVFK